MILLDTHSHSTLLSNNFSIRLSKLICKITFKKWVVFGKARQLLGQFQKGSKSVFPSAPAITPRRQKAL